MRDGGQRRDLIRVIDGAPFSGVRDRHQRAAPAVQPHAGADQQRMGQGVDANPTAVARQRHQLCTVRKEFGCGAFAGLDMGVVVTIDPPEGRRQLRADQRVRRRPGGHEPDDGLGRLQQVADRGFGPGRDRVGAIAHDRAGVGIGHGGQDGRMRGVGVVRCEIHDRSSMMWSSQSSSVTDSSLMVQPRTLTPA